MARFKPAYLIHGDDHGRLAERRARLRGLAEQESGAQGLELFEGDNATPEAVALALNAMTFAIGRRFIIVEGVERWKEKDLAPLVAALETIAPDTTVTFFAREDGRVKA
ncbi:MAG: polymerase subunit delta, partial [Solirubrobacteraceae bacterium]|nr:polymerase subunit delta [Solirubrobacteraceae bacterium]